MISCSCSCGGRRGGEGVGYVILYSQTTLYGHPLNMDTQLTRTIYVALSVSVLTEFDCTWYQ